MSSSKVFYQVETAEKLLTVSKIDLFILNLIITNNCTNHVNSLLIKSVNPGKHSVNSIIILILIIYI